ncbi:MAG: hypothetical protein K6G47_11975 [Clostridia bacterium]|nr:hypothetical protein [Clostridia bacterium]
MKDARKVLALIIAFAMLFGMVSCSSSSKSKKSKSDKKTEKEEDEDEDEDEDDEDVTEETEKSEETETSEETEETETSEETEESEETTESSFVNEESDGNADYEELKELTGAYSVTPGDYYSSINVESLLLDGILAYAEGEEMEHMMDHMFYLGSTLIPDDIAEDMEVYDCKSVISYVKENETDIDYYHESLSIFEYEDEAAANKALETFKTEAVGDVILNEQEYMNNGSEGYLVFRIEFEDLLRILFGEEDISEEDLELYKEYLGELNVVIGFYQSGNRLIEVDYVSSGTGYQFATLSFISDEGFSDPYDVTNSEPMIAAYEEVFDD